MEPTGQCGIQPSLLFLVATVLITATATGLLSTALISHQWELISWDRNMLRLISSTMSKPEQVQWFLNGQIGRVNLSGLIIEPAASILWVNQNNQPSIYLVPMFGDFWTLCAQLSDEERKVIGDGNFVQETCINYFTPDIMTEDGVRSDWQHRMQNLSTSCSLVCLIILGCSALVGAFGVIKQQISAVLVTGVMYLLAGIFALFKLAIIHLKRAQSYGECPHNQTTFGLKMKGVLIPQPTIDQPFLLGSAAAYLHARISSSGLSVELGWAGFACCILVSFLWILLSKIMRYNPMSTILNVLTI